MNKILDEQYLNQSIVLEKLDKLEDLIDKSKLDEALKIYSSVIDCAKKLYEASVNNDTLFTLYRAYYLCGEVCLLTYEKTLEQSYAIEAFSHFLVAQDIRSKDTPSIYNTRDIVILYKKMFYLCSKEPSLLKMNKDGLKASKSLYKKTKNLQDLENYQQILMYYADALALKHKVFKSIKYYKLSLKKLEALYSSLKTKEIENELEGLYKKVINIIPKNKLKNLKKKLENRLYDIQNYN